MKGSSSWSSARHSRVDVVDKIDELDRHQIIRSSGRNRNTSKDTQQDLGQCQQHQQQQQQLYTPRQRQQQQQQQQQQHQQAQHYEHPATMPILDDFVNGSLQHKTDRETPTQTQMQHGQYVQNAHSTSTTSMTWRPRRENQQRSFSESYSHDETSCSYFEHDDPPAILIPPDSPIGYDLSLDGTEHGSHHNINPQIQSQLQDHEQIQLQIQSQSHSRSSSQLKSGSPGTPPKKLWEQYYGFFLNQKNQQQQQQQQQQPTHPRSYRHNHHHQFQSQSGYSLDTASYHEHRTTRDGKNDDLTLESPATVTTATTSHVTHNSFANSSSSSSSSKGVFETSNRGGKLFGSMFGGNGKQKSNSVGTGTTTASSNIGRSMSHNRTNSFTGIENCTLPGTGSSVLKVENVTQSPRSRSTGSKLITLPNIKILRRGGKSTNELDGTLRRGSDKLSYYTNSPKRTASSTTIIDSDVSGSVSASGTLPQQTSHFSDNALNYQHLHLQQPQQQFELQLQLPPTNTNDNQKKQQQQQHDQQSVSPSALSDLSSTPPTSTLVVTKSDIRASPLYLVDAVSTGQLLAPRSELAQAILGRTQTVPNVAEPIYTDLPGQKQTLLQTTMLQPRFTKVPEPPLVLPSVTKSNVTLQESIQTIPPSLGVSSLKSSSIKKAFTEFHNNASDSESAYLGDEPSSKGGKSLFWAQRNFHHNHHRLSSSTEHNVQNPIANQDTTTKKKSDNSNEGDEHIRVPQTRHKSSISHGNLSSFSQHHVVERYGQQIRPQSTNSARETFSVETIDSTFPKLPTGLMTMSFPQRLDTVHENVTIHSSMRMLRPIQSVEVWQTGRRYLIAPAALAACPPDVVSAFWGYSSNDADVDNPTNSNMTHEPFDAQMESDFSSLSFQSAIQGAQPNASYFGSILLGQCLLSYRSTSSTDMTGTVVSSTAQQWSAATLVLRQNYLFEFDPDHDFTSSCVPRGYIHLEHSECIAHPFFPDALELHFYASPCAKSDKRILLIRIQTSNVATEEGHDNEDSENVVIDFGRQDVEDSTTTALPSSNVTGKSSSSQYKSKLREYWKTCFTRSASLRVEDLYEFPTSPLQSVQQQRTDGIQLDASSSGSAIASTSTDNNRKIDDPSVLGRGAYVTVRAARRRQYTTFKNEASQFHSTFNPPSQNVDTANDIERFDIALKIFEKNDFWKMVVKGRERADTLVRETAVQATLTVRAGSSVGSFLRLRGIFETVDKVVLELERIDGTDLFNHISSRGSLKEVDAARIMRDLLQSLRAMNRLGLAHRDVKPANILVCNSHSLSSNDHDKTVLSATSHNTHSNDVVIKLADFGMATFVGVDGQIRGRCGTPGYVAPEIFSAGLHGGYANRIDIFSAGVVLYVMLCGYEPFYGETDAELVNANKNAKDVDFPEEDWSNISPEAIDLVKCMMDPSPTSRCTVKEALRHPWFSKTLPQRHGVPVSDCNLLSSLESNQEDWALQFTDGDGPCVVS